MTDKPPGRDPDGRPKLRMTFAEGQVQGSYANLAMVGHGATEFALDFAFVPPGLPEARVVRGDRQVAHHVQHVAAADRVAEGDLSGQEHGAASGDSFFFIHKS